MEPKRTGWLDAIVERANLPQLTDLGGALIIYNKLTCSGVGIHAFRRFNIDYGVVGRERRYRVVDVVAFARKQLAEVPLRAPPPRRRRLADREEPPVRRLEAPRRTLADVEELAAPRSSRRANTTIPASS